MAKPDAFFVKSKTQPFFRNHPLTQPQIHSRPSTEPQLTIFHPNQPLNSLFTKTSESQTQQSLFLNRQQTSDHQTHQTLVSKPRNNVNSEPQQQSELHQTLDSQIQKPMTSHPHQPQTTPNHCTMDPGTRGRSRIQRVADGPITAPTAAPTTAPITAPTTAPITAPTAECGTLALFQCPTATCKPVAALPDTQCQLDVAAADVKCPSSGYEDNPFESARGPTRNDIYRGKGTSSPPFSRLSSRFNNAGDAVAKETEFVVNHAHRDAHRHAQRNAHSLARDAADVARTKSYEDDQSVDFPGGRRLTSPKSPQATPVSTRITSSHPQTKPASLDVAVDSPSNLASGVLSSPIAAADAAPTSAGAATASPTLAGQLAAARAERDRRFNELLHNLLSSRPQRKPPTPTTYRHEQYEHFARKSRQQHRDPSAAAVAVPTATAKNRFQLIKL